MPFSGDFFASGQACHAHKDEALGPVSSAFTLAGAKASYHPNLVLVPTHIHASLRFDIPTRTIHGVYTQALGDIDIGLT
jgi:hypothetical protein